jgi:uncharacterized protein (DUF2267 family)
MPLELMHASEDFERFLADAGKLSGLASRNQTYTMTQGVFNTFRRRLDLREAIRFANVLPPVLRAIFIADWNTDEVPVSFADRATMTQEVQALRKNHNFSPDSCIRDAAAALRKNIDQKALDEVLTSLPKGSTEYWSV